MSAARGRAIVTPASPGVGGGHSDIDLRIAIVRNASEVDPEV